MESDHTLVEFLFSIGMPSPPGERRPFLAHRAPYAAPASINTPLALTLNPPSSLAQCTSANIAWTGGTPPYTLTATLTFLDTATSPPSQWGSSASLGTALTSIGLVWSTNVFQGTHVSFEVTDASGVRASSPEPILVGSSGDECRLAFPPPLVGATLVQEPSPSGVLSSTGTRTTSAPPPSLTVPTTSQAAVRPGASLDGTSIALIFLGIVVFLLLGGLLLWWLRSKTRRRDGREGAYLPSLLYFPYVIRPILTGINRETRHVRWRGWQRNIIPPSQLFDESL